MAEIKNNFTGGKMNKDLDDRLVPANEYRDAVNLQISKSENSDVGSLQTVLGNGLLVDFNDYALLDYPELESIDLKCIGQCVDESMNVGYFFLTNYTDNTFSSQYSPTAINYIFKYDFGTNIVTKLVYGPFLNFSTTNPVIGVNIIEDLLFWTDNRNQPRKINVNSASNNPNYYFSEDSISVAKYYPYKTIELWEESEEDPGFYETTMKDVSSKYYPNGGECFTDGPTVDTSSFAVKTITGFITNGLNVGYVDNLTGEITMTNLTVVSYNELSSTLTLSSNIDLDDDVNLVFSVNPYYNPNFPGDTEYLKDRFVRFSYRFKFDDGEYSLIAPFTQIAFIPQQDGYFIYDSEFNVDDEESSYRSTIVSFMQNKVTQINLVIPLPINKSLLKNTFKITELDIIYKESDGLSLKVIESIPIENIEQQISGGAENFIYEYNSKKPYKTLPSNEITRVYDKVPVKALSQEIISNRVVYGNYQDKHTPLPNNTELDYNVAVSTKYDFDITNKDFTSKIEYPNHSLKQNRSYQVGVVLADKYGRQSTVLLSGNTNTIVVDGQAFSGSTVFAPYINENINPMSWPGSSLKIAFNELIPIYPELQSKYPGVYNGDITSEDYNPLGWHSYKIVVKQTEQEYYNVYLPGVMAAYPQEAFKEIGKTSHIALINDNINKVPRDLSELGPTQKQFRSSVRLYNRVNPIERNSVNDPGNKQYYPGKTSMIVSTIADNLEMFNGEGDVGFVPSEYFYNVESNPLIGRVSTSKKFGAIASGPYTSLWTNLGTVETAPVESLLEIFWETSTSGSVVELNEIIEANSGGEVRLNTWNTPEFNESMGVGASVISSAPGVFGGVYLVDAIGAAIYNNPQIITSLTMSVQNLGPLGGDVTSYFDLQPDPLNPINSDYPKWFLTVTQDFYDNVYFRGGAESQLNNFVFTFTATVDGINRILSKNLTLLNIDPVAIDAPDDGEIINVGPMDPEFIRIKGLNGCSNILLANQPPLQWSLKSAATAGGIPVNYFTVSNETIGDYVYGVLRDTLSGPLDPTFGPYEITMRLTDAGGVGDALDVFFKISPGFVPVFVREYYFTSSQNVEEKFVMIEVPSGTSYTSGFYAYMGSWTDLVSSSVNNIIVVPSSGYSCPSGWLYNSTLLSSMQDSMACLDNMPPPVLPNFNSINTFGFVFTL